MPIEVSWLVPNRVILMRGIGDVDVAGIQAGSAQIKTLIEASNAATVHVVGDETDLGETPRNVFKVLSALDWFKHEKLGWVIFYGRDDKFIKMMTGVGATIANIKMKRVITREEAITFLSHLSEDLPDMDAAFDAAGI